MDATRRAVITGIGVISPMGIGVGAHWDGLRAGRSAARRLTLFDTSHTSAKHAAWIDEWNPRQWISPHRLKRMERFSQFAVAAGHLAVRDAQIGLPEGVKQHRVGVSLGTALGGFAHGEERHTAFMQSGPASVPPALGVQVFPASAHGHLAIEFGCTGPGTTNTNSCAAGNCALGDALRMIQRGEADVVLAGAAEAPISPLIYKAFDNLGAMSSYDGEDAQCAYRPYHRERSGFVMGEGAAVFVVESLAHAVERGAAIYGEMTGYALTTDGYHMSSPEPSGEALQRCIRLAMEEARLTGQDLDAISPHASGTPANDVNELEQLTAVLGPYAGGLPIAGIKPYTGHTLGAAGAMEVASVLLSMKHQWLPGTPGLTKEGLDAAAEGYQVLTDAVAVSTPIRNVLTLSLGFGGINSALILSTPPSDHGR